MSLAQKKCIFSAIINYIEVNIVEIINMKTLTDCVNQLKTNLQAIAGTAMTQSYEGLTTSIFETDDSKLAREFVESLKNNNLELDRSAFDNLYSKKALQAVWNLVDILSISLTYTPSGSSLGILRGFMANGLNNEYNLSLLSKSIDYIDSRGMLPLPYVVDDVTYRLNLTLLDFVKEAQETKQGRALFETIRQLTQAILFHPILIDKDIIVTATENINAYKQYQMKQASILVDDGLVYYDAQDGLDHSMNEDEPLFYDTMSDEPEKNTLSEKEKRETIRLLMELFAKQLSTLKVSLQVSHQKKRMDEEKKYNDLMDCFEEMNRFVMDPNHSLKSICEYIINNKALDVAFEKLPVSFQPMLYLFEICGFSRPFIEKNTTVVFNTYKNKLISLDETQTAVQSKLI